MLPIEKNRWNFLMKLLFDENLSPRLVEILADIFPNSLHVHQASLGNVPDNKVWDYALENDYVIVTKDADFQEYSLLFGFPPKIVWIRKGNCSTSQIAQLLKIHAQQIHTLFHNPDIGILIVR